MAFRNRIECFICNNALLPRVMVRLGGENNIVVRQDIAISRRDQAGQDLQLISLTKLQRDSNVRR